MKSWTVLCFVLALAGCKSAPPPPPPAPSAPVIVYDSDGAPHVMIDGIDVERVAFTPGVSSVTVEKMGKTAGCASLVGAGLVTPPGPVEVYRMRCVNGTAFLARCEFRQCRAMQ